MEKTAGFPDPRNDAVDRMKAFQSLSPTARWETLAAVIDIGWKLINASPHREAILRRMDKNEEEWRRVQRELFSRYERGLLPFSDNVKSERRPNPELDL